MIYLYNLWRLYVTIQSLHGAYVTYRFLSFIVVHTYNGGKWILSFFYNPYEVKQIEDIKYVIEEKDSYLIIQ